MLYFAMLLCVLLCEHTILKNTTHYFVTTTSFGNITFVSCNINILCRFVILIWCDIMCIGSVTDHK